jgi:hypothetical protein
VSSGYPVRTRPRRRARTAALAAIVLAPALLAMAAAGGTPAAAQPAHTTTTNATAASASSTSDAFTQTKTMERTNLINGQVQVVDQRTVTLSVNETTNLTSRQDIQVSWTGAHPTGGILTDPNNGTTAGYQEYPMVLLECHGDAQQITPEDCFTSLTTERYFSSDVGAFPPWRLDQYATGDDASQRNLIVNEPNPLPATCLTDDPGYATVAQYWLPYVTPSGQTYSIGPGFSSPNVAGCAGAPNEMTAQSGLGNLPDNEFFAATNAAGQGSANFAVWTSQLAPDLGCSQSVSCSLVAVPVMGISCDPAGSGLSASDPATADCEDTGYWSPGSGGDDGDGDSEQAVEGYLWWAASNWRNRFVVPLTFAPASNICSIVAQSSHYVQIYGSELLDQAAQQWEPHFCLNSNLFNLTYVGIPEPQAATELEGGEVEAALVTDQPSEGFPEPVVHAPVAATGFAISFTIDNDKTHQPVTTLHLDARLLAKLLTESYSGLSVNETDPELEHPCTTLQGVTTECTNPIDITDDPEFQALNPGIPPATDTEAASTLLALSSQSDVMYALTSYINDDPAARAWLNGVPDPWGMVVNSAYKGIQLPVSTWPLLSTYKQSAWLQASSAAYNQCYVASPAPILNLIAAPVPDLPDIAEDLQFAIAQPDTSCNYDPSQPITSLVMAPEGPQGVGGRFMIGVTSLADAERYDLNTASLLTYTAPSANLSEEFTSSAGMTFVAPTNASLKSAVSLLTADPTNEDWDFPYSDYGQDSTQSQNAYPGTMLVYADIPTKGLKASDAADYANFLQFAATSGQDPGGGVGQLPDGYLPMTAANGLGTEVAYTKCAAAAVAAQQGAIPALGGPCPSGSGTSSSPGPSSSATSPSSSPQSSPTVSPTRAKTSPSSSPLSNSHSVANVGFTRGQSFGLDTYILLGVAGLAILGGVAALLITGLTRPGGRRFGLAAAGSAGAALTAGLSRLRGKRWG